MAKKTENCGNINGRQILVLLLLTSLITTAVEGATGTVNYSIVHQQLEGFGAAIYVDSETLVGRSYREAFYDFAFRDLGLDIIRIRNNTGSSYMNATGTIVTEAKERNPKMKILLTPWSPPASLKSGSPPSEAGGTLAGGPSAYVYDGLATWWADSITSWAAKGVVADYISIQNEPDITTSYDSCRYNIVENSSWAGYDQAFEHVFQEVHSRMGPNMPKMIGPDSTGYAGGAYDYPPRGARDYIDNLINEDHCYGFSFHMYSSGDGGASGWEAPDSHLPDMADFVAEYDYKPLFMTEYVHLDDTPSYDDGWKLAWHMHNALYHLNVTSYDYWTLFRNSAGGMIGITSTTSYAPRDVYWFFKAYSYFTDPNWYVLDVTTNPSINLRMSAFKNPDSNQLTVVILNKNTTTDESLTLTLNDFSPTSSAVYRTSDSNSSHEWVSLGTFSNPISLPKQSITTIHFTGSSSPVFPDCDALRAAGYGLTSDIYHDCYVDFKDFATIADYWLSKDCGWLNDYCDGADFKPMDGKVDFFDLGTFVKQWLWCNNPNDPDCDD
jgi:glucuronoarabinoxylan endo-1,4-beta-xylanase